MIRQLMIKTYASLLLAALLWPQTGKAIDVKDTYPRLANYFLRWEITDQEAIELAKWDLLVLDMEVQENSRYAVEKIRALNPDVIILAYVTSQEILDNIENYRQASLRQKLSSGISDGWWLRDQDGQRVSNWPYTSMLNLSAGALPDSSGQRFIEYLPAFVDQELRSSGLWDGVFYDNTWGDVDWIKPGQLDLDNDGRAETVTEANRLWSEGVLKMLQHTRQLCGPDFIIVGNGRVYDGYQGALNGMMLESFPSSWENGGTWAGSMATYARLPRLNTQPALPIINIYDQDQSNFRRVRFGLASALLGDGYFSYDADVTNHGQTWWYDEYNVVLGKALTPAYNLLKPDDFNWQAGLWRRDFKNGSALVNSTKNKLTYIFRNEELEKIKGDQDSRTNSGQKISYITLAPEDGIILKKTAFSIVNSPFKNGYFYRSFNAAGQQPHPGFFAYNAAFSGGAAVAYLDGLNGSGERQISTKNGWVVMHENSRAVASFAPYTKNFKKDLNIALHLADGRLQIIATGAGKGGGPQIGIFAPNGQAIKSWFAYDKNARSGVKVAIADLDQDGRLEVIAGPGGGQEPLVKIFNLNGQLQHSFLAYDKDFRGGVEVAAGDINGDGQAEIVTVPAEGGGPQVMIFNAAGKMLNSWFAYDKNMRSGYKLSLSDLEGDGTLEILVGIKSF